MKTHEWFLRIYTVALAVAFTAWAHAAQVQPIEGGPVHEAYLSPVTEAVDLEAVEKEPPPSINEKIPPQPDAQLVWISGYWAWDTEREDFVWVSGLWRRPPPGRHWIAGLWKNYDEGWVWIHGFWSQTPPQELNYIAETPPDQLDESIPPSLGKGYFWVSGYWDYSHQSKSYSWLAGRWEKFDPNWVLTPAHYVWRPGGYVFASAYWDYPIEQRGRAYSTVYIPPRHRIEVIYEPVVIIEPAFVVQYHFVHYPNYAYFYHHHYHHHPTFWVEFGCAPPWWGWDAWWGFSWHHHWGVWWWYTHPGYPQPHWITADHCRRMPPHHVTITNKTVIKNINIVKGPTIITKRGAVPPSRVRAAATEVAGKDKHRTAPILPSNPRQIRKIKDNASASEPETDKPLKPSGESVAKDDDKTLPLEKPSARRGGSDREVRPPQDEKQQREVVKPPTKPSESAPAPREKDKPKEKTKPSEEKPPPAEIQEPKSKSDRPAELRPPIKKRDGTKEGDPLAEPKPKEKIEQPTKPPTKEKGEPSSEPRPPIKKREQPVEQPSESKEKIKKDPEGTPPTRRESEPRRKDNDEPKPPIKKSADEPRERREKPSETRQPEIPPPQQPPIEKPTENPVREKRDTPPLEKAPSEKPLEQKSPPEIIPPSQTPTEQTPPRDRPSKRDRKIKDDTDL